MRFSLSAMLLALSLAAGSVIPVNSQSGAGGAPSAVAPAIRVTPPAPVSDVQARQAELAERRARVAKEVGNGSMLVLFSGEPRVYTNDVDYEFRQENNLYYLTGLAQQRATLVLVPGHAKTREILFIPRRNPAAETWTGHMYSPEEARAISGINEIWEAAEFEPFMNAIRSRRAYRPKDESILLSNLPAASPAPTPPAGGPAVSAAQITGPAAQQNAGGFETLFGAMAQKNGALYLLLPGGEGESREFRREQAFASRWAQSSSGLLVRDAWPIFMEMRLRKSPWELQLLQHAVDITTEALGRAMAVAGRSKWEYEVEAEVDYTFKRRHADNWGYPSIVGCGPNATTLHYVESEGPVGANDLILMDVGAEYGHYTADVTRTFPVSGRFTAAQADIYNAVLAAQEASMAVARPGNTFADVNRASIEVIKDALLRLGLITDRNSSQYARWFMHGTSHWLGMNVHDVGALNTKFEPNMVFTIEPGIYIRPDALDTMPKTEENRKFAEAVRPAFEKYKGIGVRIEDDVVITTSGHRNMSVALPRTLADVENFMARAVREVRAENKRQK
ncbi:MAG TPA: aminopeptidase P family protein [Pyrinomonadaceae bacterium]|nr:aminopeptidase P family protein [Pyrinomonadaceae bacterium]